MKKIKVWCILIIIVILVFPLFGQEEEKKLYVKNFDVEKVYSSRYGFKVIYWTTSGEISEIYIPSEWFQGFPSKADIAYGKDTTLPYLQVTWLDGEINHLRIYAFENMRHHTWGALRNSEKLKNLFESSKVEIKF